MKNNKGLPLDLDSDFVAMDIDSDDAEAPLLKQESPNIKKHAYKKQNSAKVIKV